MGMNVREIINKNIYNILKIKLISENQKRKEINKKEKYLNKTLIDQIMEIDEIICYCRSYST